MLITFILCCVFYLSAFVCIISLRMETPQYFQAMVHAFLAMQYVIGLAALGYSIFRIRAVAVPLFFAFAILVTCSIISSLLARAMYVEGDLSIVERHVTISAIVVQALMVGLVGIIFMR